jgi:antitoxin component YwqK of YwqJK toxin-antitoxin module
MKITLKELIEKEICEEALERCRADGREEIEVEELLELLEEEKNTEEYILWVYRNLCLSGMARNWYPDGQLQEKTTFENGKLHGEYERYYSDGQLQEKTTYEKGKMHGEFESYYPSGQLKIKSTFENGKQHGDYESYYPNGQLEIKTTYENGKRHGEYDYYRSNGQLWEKTTYDQGRENNMKIDIMTAIEIIMIILSLVFLFLVINSVPP